MTSVAQVLKTLPAKSWDILAEDYDVGHNNAQVFSAAATKIVDTVNKQLFSPLGTSDFGSYISQLKGTSSDGLLLVEYGTDASSFITQAAQFGLLGKYKSIIGIDTLNDPLLPAVGKNGLGMYETVDWAASLNNSLNNAFVASWKKQYGSVPYYVEADNYLGMQAIFHAVDQAKSINPAAVQKALRNLSFNSIVGQVTFNPQDNQMERPQYIVQVVKGNIAAGLGWKIVDTVPASASIAANSACHMSGS
jgi:branched-chain amino acid transport system substrate-binding protein